MQHFHAAYAPIASEVVYVAAPARWCRTGRCCPTPRSTRRSGRSWPTRTLREAPRLLRAPGATPSPFGDAIDLDQRVAHEVRHADAGARRTSVRREEAGIDFVHGVVVALEARQEHPDTAARWRSERSRDSSTRAMLRRVTSVCARMPSGSALSGFVEVAAELAGQENQAVGFGGMAAGRNRARKAVEDVELGVGHDASLKEARGSGEPSALPSPAPRRARALEGLKSAIFQAVYRTGTHWYGPPRRGREWPFCRLKSTT